MEFLLKELINPNTALLTDTQKTVLLMIHVSTSPEMAHSDTSYPENLVRARGELLKLSMVEMNRDSLHITDRGNTMLVYHNLIDDTGMLTKIGNDVMNNTKNVGTSYNDQTIQEEFTFLASLL